MPDLRWVLFFTSLPVLAQNVVPSASPVYLPPTPAERFRWFARSTYGPGSVLYSGPVSSAIRTWRNRPDEWGPGWEGFGKRYGTRFVNNSVTNGVEASLGAVFREDPRYHRAPPGSTVKQRIGVALKQVFLARRDDGGYSFGISRAAGMTTGAFAQNAWMPASVASNNDALRRIAGAYAGKAVGNLAREFVPDSLRFWKRIRNRN